MNKPDDSKTEREYYTLRSLVEEITGAKEDDDGFDSAYKAVQRIVKSFQSLPWVEKGKMKIHKNDKAAFVKATKTLYDDKEMMKIGERISSDKKNATIEEFDRYYKFLVDSLAEGKSDEEKELIYKQFSREEEDKYFDLVNLINEMVEDDMNQVHQFKLQEVKYQALLEYKRILEVAFIDWRMSVVSNLMRDKIYLKVLKENPYLADYETKPDLADEFQHKVNEAIAKLNFDELPED